MMEDFTPLSAAIGGLLIGLGATLLMAANGRIAGISGIVGGLPAAAGDNAWRLAFVAGLLLAPLLHGLAGGPATAIDITPSLGLLIAGGLLVGYGTRLGQGCTSGHGVCGLARFSPRSLAATVTFLAAGLVATYVLRHVIGG